MTDASGRHKATDWENPKVLQRNREPAHATAMPCPDAESALRLARERSPFYLARRRVEVSLGGGRRAIVRPISTGTISTTRHEPEIPVPSNWKCAATAVRSLNIRYPFEVNPPHVLQPVGLARIAAYSRFRIPGRGDRCSSLRRAVGVLCLGQRPAGRLP